MVISFDLRNKEGAIKFLIDWLEVDKDSIENFLICSNSNFEVDDFLQFCEIDLSVKSIDNIKYIASHVTTTVDNLEFMKSNGLMDLATLLSIESPLKQFLSSNGLVFNIEKKQLYYNGFNYDIDYYRNDKSEHFERGSLEEKIDRIAHKICYDNQISAFFTMEGDKKYPTQIHERPEFLMNITNFCKKDIGNIWAQKAKPYVIVFEEDFSSFQWLSFYDREWKYFDDLPDLSMHKEWMVRKALNLIWTSYYYTSKSEVLAYMKPNYVIPWANVIECRCID